MGELLQLFKTEPDPKTPFVLEDVVDEAMGESMNDAASIIEEMWGATSERDFLDRIRSLKELIAGWPGG